MIDVVALSGALFLIAIGWMLRDVFDPRNP